MRGVWQEMHRGKKWGAQGMTVMGISSQLKLGIRSTNFVTKNPEDEEHNFEEQNCVHRHESAHFVRSGLLPHEFTLSIYVVTNGPSRSGPAVPPET